MQSMASRGKQFDADDYLRRTYWDVNIADKILFRLENLHKAFQTLPSSLKVLDYGAGPVFLSVISAAGRASEIVLSDVAEGNREALRRWLRHDPTAFNWSPFFDHVVQKLESKSEEKAREREERVRHVVKDVVHCDINEDPPVSKGFEGPYDVVLDSWCLQDACKTSESYEMGVAKLVHLLKPGGTLMIFAAERKQSGTYVVGPTTYKTLAMTGESVAKVVQEQGLSEISVNQCRRIYTDDPRDDRDFTTVGYLFVTAKKN